MNIITREMYFHSLTHILSKTILFSEFNLSPDILLLAIEIRIRLRNENHTPFTLRKLFAWKNVVRKRLAGRVISKLVDDGLIPLIKCKEKDCHNSWKYEA